MVNDCFENNQNMRASLKPAPTDGFPNNYAFYCSYRPIYEYVHNKTHDRYNETHDRASLLCCIPNLFRVFFRKWRIFLKKALDIDIILEWM